MTSSWVKASIAFSYNEFEPHSTCRNGFVSHSVFGLNPFETRAASRLELAVVFPALSFVRPLHLLHAMANVVRAREACVDVHTFAFPDATSAAKSCQGHKIQAMHRRRSPVLRICLNPHLAHNL